MSISTDPSTLSAAAASTGATSSSASTPIDRGEAQMFARLMDPNGLAAHNTPGVMQDAAMGLAAQIGGNARSFEEIRSTMLQSIDLRDPVRTMFSLTDSALEAQAMFARLHISSSLASAATSLFSTLLKNQQ